MSFRCTYCGVNHPDDLRAQEHIIPEHLGSGNFVHRDTCLRINNGLARAVENPFHRQTTIDEILIILNPPAGSTAHFRETLTTARSTTESLYMHRGQLLLADKPVYETTRVLPMTFRRRDARTVQYSLKLPFDLLVKATGSELLLTPELAQKKTADNKRRLLEHLRRLKDDPSLDPDFHRFVQENDIVLGNPSAQPTVAHHSTPNTPVSDLAPQPFYFNLELAARYFIKTALLYAAETGQAALLDGAAGDELRLFLTGFYVDRALACDEKGRRIPVFAEGTIAGIKEYWWAEAIDQSVVAINTRPDIASERRDELLLENDVRAFRFNSIMNRVHLEKMGSIGPPFYAAPHAYAYHELEFVRHASTEQQPGIWCRINLFGGIFSVEVQVSENPDAPFHRIHRRITTPWYAGAT